MTSMKLGLGLYRHMLKPEYFQFAQQCGCTHLIVHLANYYTSQDEIVPATDAKRNYGKAAALDPIWEPESLRALQKQAAAFGQQIYGIENFSPADWYDVLLDGPRRDEQLENLKRILRNVGQVGIRAFGYNFSLAGVWGHQKKHAARGGALSTCFDASLLDLDTPIPNGEVWNMTYGPSDGGVLAPITSEELWQRLRYFLDAVLPVAQEAGVELALHPDDPPMPSLRGTPRLVYRPELYQQLIDMNPSPANKLELCLGSLQEMQGGDIYEAVESYARQGRISYVHFRNVKGKVPCYDEVFIDEGDVDMLRMLTILEKEHFDGVLVPDHTPYMVGDAPWHTGMAFALGYMRAAFTLLDQGRLG